MKKLPAVIALIASLVLAGCGQVSHHFIQSSSDTQNVAFDVMLDKPFVAGISSLSGGQAAMLILVGPFTNNAVLLVAREGTDNGEKIAFRERLKWGHNTFSAVLKKNTKYQLVAVVQGTRSGGKDVGTITVSETGSQHFTVNLLENEVSVE